MKKIYIREDLSWEQEKNAIEMSLIMGFYSVSAKFPITSKEEGLEIPEDLTELKNIYKIKSKEWPSDYTSATKAAKPIPDLDWRKTKGLETLFSKGIFLKDENHDQLPDKLDFKIDIPKDSSLSMLIAACNIAFRFGMETTAYKGPIIAQEDWKSNLIKFQEDNEVGMEIIEENGSSILAISGQGEELENFTAKICESLPLLAQGRTWIDQLQEMTDSFAMENLDGQLAYLKAYEDQLEGPITAYLSPKVEEKLDEIQKIFPKVEFKNHKSNKKIYEKVYDIPWEVDTFKDILAKKVYPKLKPEDKVEIYAALSEDIDARKNLMDEIKDQLEENQIQSSKIQIVSAYKQGFSWIEEVVLPQLKHTGTETIEKIEIAFKPFLPEGQDEWLDEDGAVPSYNNVNSHDPDKWFDLPIRFLQELYPIDDIISREVKIHRDKINFIVYEGEEDITYQVEVFGDKEIPSFQYKAAYSERPYLDDYPQLGKVHPSTGYIKVMVNGQEVLHENIATDLENIWDIYQSQVLPECREFIETKIKGKDKDNIILEDQPFFSQLRLEVDASEPDYALPFREDLISSLNALHQDLYFVGLDYFENYGLEKNNIILDAPGLILPVIKKTTGKPRFKVVLYDQLEASPCLKADNKTISNPINRKDIELYLQKLSYRDGQITGILNTNLKDEKLIESYIHLLDQGLLEASSQFKAIDNLKIITKQNHYRAKIREPKEPKKNLSILDIDLMEDTLIGYEDYLDIINQLKHVAGIDVYKIATSYLGRDIYAIEILPKEEGYISRTKRITNLPAEIINGRHHANEVSATNAAFILLKKLLTEDKYEALPDKLNLVIVPMENVDGTEIHYELQKDNPNWKLHVARFNAIGKEFYYEYFNPDTIHTEALAMTKLWEKYLPDVIVDNHGVPSHEWDQQFSGYTSPSYKGFWLPRSLLYGYFWLVSDEEYKGNYTVNKEIEKVIAQAISRDREITTWNKEWMSIFHKYAHGWMPKLFPADYYEDMINYWISFEFDPLHRYPSIRFPWITSVAYTSEVADETAHGKYLNLCARTHVNHMEAVIEMLMNSKSVFESKCEISNNRISIKDIRHRPLIV